MTLPLYYYGFHGKVSLFIEDNSKNRKICTCLDSMNLTRVTIYRLTSCNTEERIAQNIYIHNSNRNYKKKINYNKNIDQETDRHRL